MKSYIKLIPLMLYPYAYLIWIFLLDGLLPDDIHSILPVIYIILTLSLTVYSTIVNARNNSSAKTVAKQNLIVKAVQIPAYMFHFVMGLVGIIASVWGIAFITIAIIIDYMTIILTGIFSIGCNIKIYKRGIISKGTAIFTGILSFTFCIDLIVACILLVISASHEKKQLTQKENL